MTMLNQNAPQDIRLPLTEDDALTKYVAPLARDSQGETQQVAKKGNLSDAVSGAVAGVLASRFIKAITSVALGGIVSEGAFNSAPIVEAPDYARSISISSPDVGAVAAAHPHA